jgi:hypothetical protein
MPEQLLYTISSVGHMSLENFYSAFDSIQLRGISDMEINLHEVRRSSIRFLDALGHCEFDFEKRQVFVCPPTLVTLPVSGLPNAVLTGARTPSLIQDLEEFKGHNKDAVFISKISQVGIEYLLPATIIIEAINFDYLEDISDAAGINSSLVEPASWSLSNFSLGIEELIDSLLFETRDDLNWYKEFFSSATLRFSKFGSRKSTHELISYTNPVNQQWCHLIWDGQKAAKVDRDWGRYIVLLKHNRKVLLYDERRHHLAVPATVPLPRFLGRAAALCSGLAPESAKLGENTRSGLPAGHPVDVYSSVPPLIAGLIAAKLSQDLIRCSIVIDENGVIA